MGRLLQRPETLRSGAQVTHPQGSPAARESTKLRQRTAAIRMQTDLADLLDQHAAARQLMRQLDVVECALRRGDLLAWERLVVRVHVKALAELESLVWDGSTDGLAELRSRTAVRVRNKPADDAPQNLCLDATQHADVTEVEHSIFEESQRSWAGGGAPGTPSAAPVFAPTQAG